MANGDMGFSGGYSDALGRAAEARARHNRADTKRQAENNPFYGLASAGEAIAPVVDLGLGLAGLPPVATPIAKGVKGIAGGLAGVEGESIEGGAAGLAGASRDVARYQSQKEAREAQKSLLKELMGSGDKELSNIISRLYGNIGMG
jgi:hypothetical protein